MESEAFKKLDQLLTILANCESDILEIEVQVVYELIKPAWEELRHEDNRA